MDTLTLSQLEDFNAIMVNPQESWKTEFKKWFSHHLFVWVSNIILAKEYSANTEFYYDSALTADVTRKIEESLLKDNPEGESDEAECGRYRVAYLKYEFEHKGLKNFLKKGTLYTLKHPCVLWRMLTRCHKANIGVAFHQLVKIARRRFIKEGGSAESFRQFMLA